MKSIVYRLVLLLIFNFNSYAVETINIEHGRADPVPIAINKFNADDGSSNKTGMDITQVINNDLKLSGLFRPISSAAFIEDRIGIEYKPLFASWRYINAGFLVNGEVVNIGRGKVKISFILWDTLLEKQLVGEVFEVSENLWRRVAHKIADKIYEHITGDPGYFDSKIAYVEETGPYLRRVKRIAIMDFDGANHKYLTDGKNKVLTPRLSPSADKILYLSYAGKTPSVYMRDLRTNKEKILGSFSGMSFAPRFSPDASKVLISIAKDGSTHIFEIDLATRKLMRLTDGPSINTSPSYSPDGKKIVFNSDRSGSRQLYIMNYDGSDITRISFGQGAYATPSWSPRGDYIAFTKISRSLGFTIGVMKPDPSDSENSERILTSGYLVEGPCWAPNGRVILFAKGWPPKGKIAGRSRIYAIDLTGYNEREIHTTQDASDPEWSSILN